MRRPGNFESCEPIPMNKPGVLILAAGGSARLGRPKQLVKFRGKTLLQRTIDLAWAVGLHTGVVVLGGHAEEIVKSTDARKYRVVINPGWEQGMSGSLCLGLRELLREKPGLDGLLVLLSDQPLLDRGDLERLLNQHHRRRRSMATFALHGERPGVPAVFSREAFPALNRLEGDQGARKLVYLEGFEYETVLFRSPDFDIDTPEDLNELRNLEHMKISVEVRYFGVLAESAGKDSEVVEIHPGVTSGELRDLCSDRYRFSDRNSIQVAVNQRLDANAELIGGEEVALLPPFAGG